MLVTCDVVVNVERGGRLQSFVVYTDADHQAAMLMQSRVTSSGHVIKNYVSRRCCC